MENKQPGRVLYSADFTPESTVCSKCQDRGFTEKNHGLTVILCDCDKAREVAERNGIPWRKEDITVEVLGKVVGRINGNSRTEPDNSDIGSGDTSQSEQSSKPKKKRKTRKKSK